MKSISVKQSIEYWKKTAERDHETMLVLLRLKRYPESLFYGHIVLEKILKALVVQQIKSQAPYIHDLTRLAVLANVPLTKGITTLLNTVNDFNIRARYPEYKFTFYKRCTKTFTEKYAASINQLYQDLCQTLKQNE